MGAAHLSAESPSATLRAWSVVGLLAALYFVSFVDRVVLALLVQPLKADLGVSDLQLGMLFGPAFAVFYAIVGLPLARLADRGLRVPLVVGGALVWGACTIGSGFANSYLMLILLRVGLAIGEAALTPAAYALIGAIFPPRQRITAASIYSATGIAGASAAYILGAAIIHAIGPDPRMLAGVQFATWQMVFLVVGAPAVLGALAFWAVAREPARPPADKLPRMSDVWRHLRSNAGMYVPLFCGAGILQAANAAYAAWGPEYLRRDLGWDIREAGTAFGLTGLVGAALGILIVPAVARRLQERGRADGLALAAIVAGVVGAVAAVAAPLSGAPALFLLCNGLAAFGLFGSSTGLVVAMQTIAPLEHRGTLVAVLLLSITLLGQALGPPAVAVANAVVGRSGEIGAALAVVALLTAAPGLVLIAVARKPLVRFLRDAQS